MIHFAKSAFCLFKVSHGSLCFGCFFGTVNSQVASFASGTCGLVVWLTWKRFTLHGDFKIRAKFHVHCNILVAPRFNIFTIYCFKFSGSILILFALAAALRVHGIF